MSEQRDATRPEPGDPWAPPPAPPTPPADATGPVDLDHTQEIDRTQELDRSALDRALETALTRAREVRADERWPKPAWRRWSVRTGLVESHT